MFIVHQHPLKKMTLGQLKVISGRYQDGVKCDGQRFYGCMSSGKRSIERNNRNDMLYHCSECEFDYCMKCYEFYGNKTHKHTLHKMTFGQVHDYHGIDYTVWMCDACDDHRSCSSPSIKNDSIIVFSDPCGFTLCQPCA